VLPWHDLLDDNRDRCQVKKSGNSEKEVIKMVSVNWAAMGLGAVIAFLIGWFIFGLLGAVILAIIAMVVLGIMKF
jgi:fatty acid desaturase